MSDFCELGDILEKLFRRDEVVRFSTHNTNEWLSDDEAIATIKRAATVFLEDCIEVTCHYSGNPHPEGRVQYFHLEARRIKTPL